MIVPPSLQTLATRTQADLATRIAGATPQLRRSILGSIGTALSGAVNALYDYLQQLSLRGTPFTAQDTALEGWASLWKISRLPATQAAGDITIAGAQGTTIPAGTQIQTTTGVEYGTAADAMIGSGGSVDVGVTALFAGAVGNQPAGATLSFVSPLAGINATAVVDAGGLAGGTDIETDDALRARLIARLSNPPQGGSQQDYVTWALAVPGVTRAWCFPLYAGVGTVRVYVADDSYIGTTLASAATVAAAQDAIDTLKPVGVAYLDANNNVQNGLTVIAPTGQPVAITAANVPDTTEVQASVTANLQALFATATPEGTIKLHQIYKAFLDTPGLTDFTLVAPTADQVANAGNILTLGTITWE